ncbi:MAG: hypothetical protein HZB13_20860, partial [Acidobacteria bacterium]|nr:hypothetical protein [Acidobacteriota bacterium]
METGEETRISDEMVHHAEWSPSGKRVAYQWLDGSSRPHLSLWEMSTGESAEIASGPLHMEYLNWSVNSGELLFMTVEPASGQAFEDRRWISTLHRYSISRRADESIPGVEWAQFSGGQLYIAGGAGASAYPRIPNSGQGKIERFVMRGGLIYANISENGKEAVRRWNAAAGAYEFLTWGRLMNSSDKGVLVRDASSSGVVYKYLPDGWNQPVDVESPRVAVKTAAAAGGGSLQGAGTNWKLPYYGQAALVQGGQSYIDSSC